MLDHRTFVGDLQGSGREWWPLLVAFSLVVVPACKHDPAHHETTAPRGSALAVSSAPPEPAPSQVPPSVAVPSLCVELDAWTKALIEAGADIEGTLPRYRARNKAATGGTRELFRISGEFDRISRAKAESFRAKETALKAHPLANGEAPIQADLLKGYSATATAYEKFTEAFHAGPAGFPELQGLDQTMRGTMASLAQKLDAELKKKCGDLATTSASTSASASDPPNALLNEWLRAQNIGDFSAYQKLYAPEFVGVKRVGSGYRKEFDRAGWIADRRNMFNEPMSVQARETTFDRQGEDVLVRFTQQWSAGTYADEGTKELRFRPVRDKLLIVREELRNSKVLSGAGADCLPCRTQEDFDGASTKHTKCCETHACRTDDECPVGRVCCRIPGGELCASVKRCTPPNRVEH